jgi:hypothetical protein
MRSHHTTSLRRRSASRADVFIGSAPLRLKERNERGGIQHEKNRPAVGVFKDDGLSQKTGLRVYGAKPYLLVARTEAKDKPVEVSVVYLPDLANPQYIKQTSGLGSSDLKLTLSNGMITSFGSNIDQALAESLKSLGSLLSGGAEAMGKLLKTPSAGEPSEAMFDLYEIVIEAHQTVLKKVTVR